MKSKTARTRGLIASSVLIAIIGATAPAGAVMPGENGFLVAGGSVGQTEGLFAFKQDGSNLSHFAGSAGGRFPSVSPNGRKIAFSARVADNEDIYVLQPDNSVVRVTNDLAVDKDPAWSPNGQEIVFVSNREGNEELYIINADGSDPRRVTNNTVADTQPTWSPTNVIAFTRQESAGSPSTDIFLINPNGTGEDQLTVDNASASEPNFAPDGTKLVYTLPAPNASANDDIYVVNVPSGTGVLNVTNTETVEEHDAVFSPDGAKIVYLRGYLATEIDVVSIGSFGGAPTLLVDNTSLEDLDWQPLCDTCDTNTTLDVKYKGGKLSAKGTVTPPRPGQSVIVALYKKVGGKLAKVSQKSVPMENNGSFATLLKRVDGNKCKVKAIYRGDDDYFGSQAATPLFPC